METNTKILVGISVVLFLSTVYSVAKISDLQNRVSFLENEVQLTGKAILPLITPTAAK